MTHDNADARRYGTDRDDGRFCSTQGFVHSYIKHSSSKLAYPPDLSADEFADWRDRVREKLRELMGFPVISRAPEPKRLFSRKRDGYRLEEWESYPEPGSVVPFLMLIPENVDDQHPGGAVMCFPGSASSKELLAGEPELDPRQPENRHPIRNQMALHYVRAGIVSVVVENPGTAELADGSDLGAAHGAGREKLAAELIAVGRSYVGLSVFQKLSLLEWLRSVPCVDASRIAVSGHSLGTEPAMCMAVLDERIAALVFNDFVCSLRTRLVVTARPEDGAWRHTSPLWHLIPGLLSWFDFPDLLCAVAPRPLLITEGGVTTSLQRIQSAYAHTGAEKAIEYHYYPRYRDQSDRIHDDEGIPEGLTQEEWFASANVDVANHCFKENLAVPWLARIMSQSSV